MNLREALDKIAALPAGAVITDEQRFDHRYLEIILITYRGHYIRDYFASKNRTLNGKWYQKYYPKYDPDDQDDPSCVKFKCPEVITLDALSDGLRYIGSTSGNKFNRIKNRGSFATFKKHRYTNPNSINEISVIYDGSTRMLEVYGDIHIKKFMVEAVFSNPSDPLIATFNPEVDEYPIPEDAFPSMEQMIYTGQTRISSVTAPTPAGEPSAQPKTH